MRNVQDTLERVKGLYQCGKSGGDIKKYQRNTGVKDMEILYWLSTESHLNADPSLRMAGLDGTNLPLELKVNSHLTLFGKGARNSTVLNSYSR